MQKTVFIFIYTKPLFLEFLILVLEILFILLYLVRVIKRAICLSFSEYSRNELFFIFLLVNYWKVNISLIRETVFDIFRRSWNF